jgi:alpha/beta superfamily hydrolase
MNGASVHAMMKGLAGALEIVQDHPTSAVLEGLGLTQPSGIAVLCHPHPLHGGSLDNKVVQTMARAHLQMGCRVIRFNFRGVGKSEGAYDQGQGELQDLMSVIEEEAAHTPLYLGGFSFGAMIAARAMQTLCIQRSVESLMLVGLAVSRFEVPHIEPTQQMKTLVVHGSDDDTIALPEVMKWAAEQGMPVVVMPQTGHFFHGQLPTLKALMVRHLRSVRGPGV